MTCSCPEPYEESTCSSVANTGMHSNRARVARSAPRQCSRPPGGRSAQGGGEGLPQVEPSTQRILHAGVCLVLISSVPSASRACLQGAAYSSRGAAGAPVGLRAGRPAATAPAAAALHLMLTPPPGPAARPAATPAGPASSHPARLRALAPERCPSRRPSPQSSAQHIKPESCHRLGRHPARPLPAGSGGGVRATSLSGRLSGCAAAAEGGGGHGGAAVFAAERWGEGGDAALRRGITADNSDAAVPPPRTIRGVVCLV